MTNRNAVWFVEVLKDLSTFARSNDMRDVADKLDEVILMEREAFKAAEGGGNDVKWFLN